MVTKDDTNQVGYGVVGNKCSKGLNYGIREMTNPTRPLTTTVKITNAFLNRLPVRTNGDIPKSQIFQAMKLINKVEVKAPIKAGEVIIKNVLDTGVDVIASRSMHENEELNYYFTHPKIKKIINL